MCSPMKKDALIEKVAETMVLSSRHKEIVQNSKEDNMQ